MSLTSASAASAFQAAEIFALRVRARIPAAVSKVSGAAPASRPATRTVPVYWPDTGEHADTAVHDGAGLAEGAEVPGPALVELSHTTIAVPAGASLTAGGGHFRLRLPAAQTAVKGALR